jgi:hypothetical protein
MRIRDPKTTALIFASGKMVRPRLRTRTRNTLCALKTRVPHCGDAARALLCATARRAHVAARHAWLHARCVAGCQALGVTHARARPRRLRPQVCTGAKTEAMAKLAARKYARIIQKLGFPAQFKARAPPCAPHKRNRGLVLTLCARQRQQDFTIQNIVASCDVKFPIRLEGLAYAHASFANVRRPTRACLCACRLSPDSLCLSLSRSLCAV